VLQSFQREVPGADNDPTQCIIRGDDAGIDIFFESKETEEIYIIQCKHPKIAGSDPIPEGDVKAFFSNYKLLNDRTYLNQRKTTNPKLEELANEFEYWIKQGYLIHFIFVSSGEATAKTTALVDKFNKDNQSKNVKFDVWDLTSLRDEFVSIKSIEERYPDNITLTLADGHFMRPDGALDNLTFVVRGTMIRSARSVTLSARLEAWTKTGPRYRVGQVRFSTSFAPLTINDAHGCRMLMIFMKRE
jgi:hypothetical protein